MGRHKVLGPALGNPTRLICNNVNYYICKSDISDFLESAQLPYSDPLNIKQHAKRRLLAKTGAP